MPIPTRLGRIAVLGWGCFAATHCLVNGVPGGNATQPGRNEVAATDISKVTIQARHTGWGSVETNLTLVRSNSRFVDGGHSVPEAVVSNLLATLREPPRTEIDPVDLGLTSSWLAANQTRLLSAFGGGAKDAIFPRASPRQRAWLTNALLDLGILGDAVRSITHSLWSDDSPEVEIAFSRGEVEVVRLNSSAQISFMLPWEVAWGTNRPTITYAANISHGVVALLPDGFLNRGRLQGDLLSVIAEGFPNHPKVQDQIKQMTLEESLGAETNRFLREFEITNYWMPAGSAGLFPATWMATLHRTNWPARLVMNMQTHVENGRVTQLPALLAKADTRAQPILQSPWLLGLVQGAGDATVEVAPTGLARDVLYWDDGMAKVGLKEFYDQIKRPLEQGQCFTLRERSGVNGRTSNWVVLPDGRLALVTFAGDGVLGWSAQTLGFQGHERQLNSFSVNLVGVFVSPAGQIEKVFPQASR